MQTKISAGCTQLRHSCKCVERLIRYKPRRLTVHAVAVFTNKGFFSSQFENKKSVLMPGIGYNELMLSHA